MKYKILFLLCIGFTSILSAQEDTEEVYSYDAIVDQLNTNRSSQAEVFKDPYQDVKFHIGAGFSQSILNVKANGSSDAVTIGGLEIKFGVNLLNPQWIFEGTLRNYNNTRSNGINYQLREFEGRIVHTKPFASNLFYRVGSGVAARYLETNIENRAVTKDYTTPSLILLGGTGLSINPNIAIVGDVAFKTSMVNDTVDKNTLDFTLRLDTSF